MSNRHPTVSHNKHRLHPLKLAIIAAVLPLSAHAADGLIDLGILNGGTYAYAYDVSGDSSVVVGDANDANNASRAFRWTQAGGMVSLGTLSGGIYSRAFGVSGDGSVVVGFGTDASNAGRAFRWTQAGGMASLGTLSGGTISLARDISWDGSVVVGYSDTASNAGRAFRWTQAGGMESLGTLNGGNYSYANGVSGDGSVVVGNANDASNAGRAFRWTQAGGMVSLGTLNGGNYSYAAGVSGDGSVVVGIANDANNASRAFRWTQAGGMQSVEQWLTANGATVAPGASTKAAYATNTDGSVVVGQLTNSHAFLARVSPVGSGMIDPADFNRTLYASGYTHVQADAQSDLVMHGLHGSPMRGLPGKGLYEVWVAGDWGRQDHVTSDGDVGSGEIGVSYGVSDDVMLKLALGRTYSQQDTLHGGNTTIRGTYVMPEVITSIPNTALKLSASGYYNSGDADIKRGYLNAGTPVISSGSPGAQSVALRLRLDWLDAYAKGNLGLTPYASLTWFHSHIDGYTETGGGFPVQWNSRHENTSQGRFGVDATYAHNERVKLLGRIEAVHRMDSHSSNVSGNILGLGNFELNGMTYRQNWLRAGIGAEVLAGPGVASVMVNGTTENNGPSYWAYASYRLAF